MNEGGSGAILSSTGSPSGSGNEMIELITTVIITASSVLLFGYWFRYTCLLILSAKTTRDFAGQVAAANQLGFLDVQSQLRTASANFDSLRETLDRDYAVLSSMLKQASGSSAEVIVDRNQHAGAELPR